MTTLVKRNQFDKAFQLLEKRLTDNKFSANYASHRRAIGILIGGYEYAPKEVDDLLFRLQQRHKKQEECSI